MVAVKHLFCYLTIEGSCWTRYGCHCLDVDGPKFDVQVFLNLKKFVFHFILAFTFKPNSDVVASTIELQTKQESFTYLDSKDFDLEVVNFLWPAERCDVMRLCRHADMNCDLEVVFLLANKSLIRWRVVEAFVCVDVVGGTRPATQTRRFSACCWVSQRNKIYSLKIWFSWDVLTASGGFCPSRCSTVPACTVPRSTTARSRDQARRFQRHRHEVHRFHSRTLLSMTLRTLTSFSF